MDNDTKKKIYCNHPDCQGFEYDSIHLDIDSGRDTVGEAWTEAYLEAKRQYNRIVLIIIACIVLFVLLIVFLIV